MKRLNVIRKFEYFMKHLNFTKKNTSNDLPNEQEILLGTIIDDFEEQKEVWIPASNNEKTNK